MSVKQSKFVLIGKVNVDVPVCASNEVLVDKKMPANGWSGPEVGGGSTNVARILKRLSSAMGDDADVTLFTRIGKTPDAQHFNADRQVDREKQRFWEQSTRQLVRKFLKADEVKRVDLSAGVPNPNLLTNIPINFPGGRNLYKMPSLLNGDYAKSNNHMLWNSRELLEREMDGVGYLFIDPADLDFSKLGKVAAQRMNVPIIVDHGRKEWPKDPHDAECLLDLIMAAEVVIVPGEAVLPGMGDQENSGMLFKTLCQKYPAKTIIMSDGHENVRISHDGETRDVPVIPSETPVNVSGAGDTRDAALLYFLDNGDDMFTAIEKSTVIATVKVSYPEHEWMDHIYDHVQSNPMFEKEVEKMIRTNDCESNNLDYISHG